MAGAIPALFIWIISKLAAKVRAPCMDSMGLSPFIFIDAQLLPIRFHNAAV